MGWRTVTWVERETIQREDTWYFGSGKVTASISLIGKLRLLSESVSSSLVITVPTTLEEGSHNPMSFET